MDRRRFIDSASALPEVEPGGHMRALDYWLRKKIFATLTPEGVAGFKLRPETQAILMAKSSCFFKANGAWGGKGWTKAMLAKLAPEDA